MLNSMQVRCLQCGYDNDSQYRFCGMCGAKLPLPPPPPVAAPTEPARVTSSSRPVSGPSFLGLADEPASSVSYLLEDEMSSSHWGRVLVPVILIAVAAAGWYWRQDLRVFAARFLNRSAATAANTNSSGTPSSNAESTSVPSAPSASPSEVNPVITANTDTHVDKPRTGVGDELPNPEAQTAKPANAPPGAQTGSGKSPAVNQDSDKSAQAAETEQADSRQPVAKQEEAKQEDPAPAEPATKPERATTATRVSKSAQTQPVSTAAASDALEIEGERYLYGNGVAENCSRAQKSLLAAAGQSSAKAESVLGTMYATGHCASRDLPLAYRWFARALHQDPSNTRIEQDLKVLWNQMTADERQLALRGSQ